MPKWPPQIVAQEGNYQTIELFLKVPQKSSKMAFSHILILPCCHSECSYIIRSSRDRSSKDREIVKLCFYREIIAYKCLFTHDRSCLEMSEADGVDSGAICKRGFIHLQFAEKPEAPEAERHLGSRILE
ncbi:hypothetical protein V1477_009804 [Vespula maculifrons]|uniref:Uncharacterized protein n=1 Tax=Vespula maculifrons TaxID=7453 RepID=A0ABD2CAU6_VESMC